MNIPMKKQNWNPNIYIFISTFRYKLFLSQESCFKLAFFNGNACHSKQNLYENTNKNATYRTSENGNQKKRMKQISCFKSTCTLVSEYLEKIQSSIH